MSNAQNDYARLIGMQMTPIQMIAEIERLRHELAEANEELAQRREHMRRGIEPGRPTGGEG